MQGSEAEDFEVIPTEISVDQFWQFVNILLTKPHVVNNKLWGCKVLLQCVCKPLVPKSSSNFTCDKIKESDNLSIHRLLKTLQLEYLSDSNTFQTDKNYIDIILVKLLPKNYSDNYAFQLVSLDYKENKVTFHDVTPEESKQHIIPNFPYSIQLNNKMLILSTKLDINPRTKQWLIENVLTRLNQWAVGKSNGLCIESLSLVPHDEYHIKYNELKSKYGKEMVKIWPECTDPSKFVYEDVAIATYLLLFWKNERKLHNSNNLQTFTDLGCGNGLLVYILTKEGHTGLGIDVRKRQIWDIYSSDVILKEETIIPSDSHLFPETDWIIGNHSDELTPWIPIIAARSSYKCNFFLLPCCAYNLDGSKYQRQNSSVSQYTEYLEYIKLLCKDCGFKIYLDRLKIPSTKRICLISTGRLYPKEDYNSYCDNIYCLINKHNGKSEKNDTSWIKDFKPRDSIERVRNCTQVDKTIIMSVVDCITKYLLEDCTSKPEWSLGKTVEIKELVNLISQDKLKALKSECGGLQTLIKNNHHIFKVFHAKVQLRYPRTVKEVIGSNKKANIKIKQKPCWFFNNHPQGCPLNDITCSFIHTTK